MTLHVLGFNWKKEERNPTTYFWGGGVRNWKSERLQDDIYLRDRPKWRQYITLAIYWIDANGLMDVSHKNSVSYLITSTYFSLVKLKARLNLISVNGETSSLEKVPEL